MAEKYTAAQIIEAIKASKGMIYVAARKMGCSHQTIRNYARRYPSVREAIEDERGFFVDNAEIALEKAIKRGDGWAVCFTLKTLGKDRGYVERQELSGPGGGAIEVDVAGLTDEERLARIMALLERAERRRLEAAHPVAKLLPCGYNEQGNNSASGGASDEEPERSG